jgi:hypothetical protein
VYHNKTNPDLAEYDEFVGRSIDNRIDSKAIVSLKYTADSVHFSSPPFSLDTLTISPDPVSIRVFIGTQYDPVSSDRHPVAKKHFTCAFADKTIQCYYYRFD